MADETHPRFSAFGRPGNANRQSDNRNTDDADPDESHGQVSSFECFCAISSRVLDRKRQACAKRDNRISPSIGGCRLPCKYQCMSNGELSAARPVLVE
jgi:hypothetical protein